MSTTGIASLWRALTSVAAAGGSRRRRRRRLAVLLASLQGLLRGSDNFTGGLAAGA